MTPIGLLHWASAGRLLLPPALVLLSAVLSACGGTAQGPVATTAVELPKSYRFAPAAITVPVGATVTWTNADDFTHNVAFEGAQPLTMTPGQSVGRTFATAGTYPYICSLHPKDMKGSVFVTGS